MFKPLTPKGYEGFAGNYRSPNPEFLAVNVKLGDGPWGTSFELVDYMMSSLSKELESVDLSSLSDDPEAKIINYLTLAAYTVIKFISIHPYCDGNGHISRFITCSFLMPNKLIPIRWSIEPRPIDYEYANSMISGIMKHDIKPLINYFISTFELPKN
ncbi:MAG: Fic family protein [Spirochaetaceae bacterium]|nr:Fic family protein [Spirochaetaceae bacterium]